MQRQDFIRPTPQQTKATPVLLGRKGPTLDNLTIEKPLSAEELSHILPLHPETIRKWARQGRIPCKRISARKILFLPSEIQTWLASQSGYTQPATRAAQPERMAA